MATYARLTPRTGKLSTRSKLFQGIGALPETLKQFAINTFLLLYYSQVLGLPASWVSVALFISLAVDAVTDPVVGSFSDNFRSSLGRRHLLMYASALPSGVCLYLLFAPPTFETQYALLAWLTLFSVATRVCMTFFLVPWNALFAEFSDDYEERSVIVTYRLLLSLVAGVIFTFVTFSFIFPSSEMFPQGQLNPESYRTFAAVLAISVVCAILLTTHLTRDQIQFLLQPTHEPVRFHMRRVFSEVAAAFQNREFLILLLTILASTAVGSTNQALEIYMRTYFWGLEPEQLRWFALAYVGSLIAFTTVVPLQQKIDKKYLISICAALSLIDGAGLVALRFFDVLPDNGDPLLVNLLIANAALRAYIFGTAFIMFISMVADTLDLQEVKTGLRQEGVFNSATAFMSKATSGVGILMTGLLLDAVIDFPAGVQIDEIDADTIWRLGAVDGFLVPAFHIVPMLLVLKFGITREVHGGIRKRLDAQRIESSKSAEIEAGLGR